MKRIFSVIVVCFLLSSVFPAAEVDISSLDFDALSELKIAVDQEYASRPEAQPIDMEPGFYTVGVDMQPGTYYFAYVMPTGNGYTAARMHVYESKEKYETRPSANYGEFLSDVFFKLGEIPKDITVEEGNYIWLEDNPVKRSISTFDPTEYYTFVAPDGTAVPNGTYNVSSDIPEGKYTMFAASITGGDAVVYHSEQAKEENDYKEKEIYTLNPGESVTFELKEGYIVEVRKEVIMKKAEKLSFD